MFKEKKRKKGKKGTQHSNWMFGNSNAHGYDIKSSGKTLDELQEHKKDSIKKFDDWKPSTIADV